LPLAAAPRMIRSAAPRQSGSPTPDSVSGAQSPEISDLTPSPSLNHPGPERKLASQAQNPAPAASVPRGGNVAALPHATASETESLGVRLENPAKGEFPPAGFRAGIRYSDFGLRLRLSIPQNLTPDSLSGFRSAALTRQSGQLILPAALAEFSLLDSFLVGIQEPEAGPGDDAGTFRES
jgi:hypothetical protein